MGNLLINKLRHSDNVIFNDWVFPVILSVLVIYYVSYLGKAPFSGLILLSLILFFTVLRPFFSPVFLMSLIPLNGLQVLPISAPFLLFCILVYLFGMLIRSLLTRGTTMFLQHRIVYVFFAFSIYTLMSFLFSGNFHLSAHWLAFLMSLVGAFFLVQNLTFRQDLLPQIVLVMSLLSLAIVWMPILHVGNSFSGRLTVIGNVRGAANVLGFLSVLLFSFLLFKRYALSKWIGYLFFVLALMLLASLFFTQSRGVIISVFVSLFSGFFVFVISELLRRPARARYRGLGLRLIFIGIAVVTLFNYLGQGFIRRLGWAGDSIDIRVEIWNSAILQMTLLQHFFGAGIASFRDLALRSGYDFYAHSLYVDTYVSLGMSGFLFLILIFSYIFIRAVLLGAHITFTTFLFIVFAFYSHGALNSIPFILMFAFLIFLFRIETKKSPKRIAPES